MSNAVRQAIWRKNHEKEARESNKRCQANRTCLLHNLKINGCAICGYDKCDAALEFHHVNPQDKEFTLQTYRMYKSPEFLVEELNKCILFCANCHREVEEKQRREI